jgi:hypothetical protein
MPIGIAILRQRLTHYPKASAALSRRPAVLHQPHTSFSLYPGQHFVEVLTKCRVQHLSYCDVNSLMRGVLKQLGKQ